jgi:hypothetical protein
MKRTFPSVMMARTWPGSLSRLLAAFLVTACFRSAASAQDKPLTAEAALKKLKDGNARFVSDKVLKKDTVLAGQLAANSVLSP